MIFFYLLMLLLLVTYNLIRTAFDKDFEWNYFIFIAVSVYFLWDLFTEKNVIELRFHNDEYQLIIIQKPIIGTHKSYALNYGELDFETIKVANPLRRIIAGSKFIILHKKDKHFSLGRSSGFKEAELLSIENNLVKIKNEWQ